MAHARLRRLRLYLVRSGHRDGLRREPLWISVRASAADSCSAKMGVDHIVLDGWQVDHSSIFVAGDRQVGDQRYLMSVEWSTVDLVSP